MRRTIENKEDEFKILSYELVLLIREMLLENEKRVKLNGIKAAGSQGLMI